MKVVYSHWSAPRFFSVDQRIILALSVTLARRHYDRVELITDEPGIRTIAAMGLPFTRTSTHLQGLDMPPTAWAAGKLRAYSLQWEPFIHVDADVFLFRRLPEHLEQVDVLTQSPEPVEMYAKALAATPQHHVERLTLPRAQWRAYNAGILGGRHVDFLREYAIEALRAIRDSPGFRPAAMTVYEQAFLGRHAHDRGVRVETLLTHPEEADGLGYAHLMGRKGAAECMRRVRERLQREDPALFERVVLSRPA